MGVAIVVHGTNWRDIAVKDEEGNPIYPAGVSIAFDHMLDKCIAIVVISNPIYFSTQTTFWYNNSNTFI
jgi:hypothetical protein